MYVFANVGISPISCSRYVKDVRKQEGLIEMMLRVYDLKYIVSYIKNNEKLHGEFYSEPLGENHYVCSDYAAVMDLLGVKNLQRYSNNHMIYVPSY
jgi:hypothetical protein